MQDKRNTTPPQAAREADAYLTFLPSLDEGFHLGYHAQPGVVCDHNQRPGDWLESLARAIHSEGSDVSYSIPDVLSQEQQLRRLARLPIQQALLHRQMIGHRAVLAMLLLWDTWPKDETWPTLELRCLSGQSTAFSASVEASLAASRAPDGLWAYILKNARDASEGTPVALLSRAMAVVPAANSGDLSALLPPCVAWYDRAERRFVDPCGCINERDATLLKARLKLLIALNSQPELQSPLYDASAALCSVLEAFVRDLDAAREPWRDQLTQGDPDAQDALRLRLLAVHAPSALPVESLQLDPAAFAPAENPLLHAFLHDASLLASTAPVTFYLLDGEAFACQSETCLMAPVRTPNEAQALDRLSHEIALLEEHDSAWRASAAQALLSLRESLSARAGLWPALPTLLAQWAQELESQPTPATCDVTVELPMSAVPAAMSDLLQSAFAMEDEALITGAFSDALLLLDGAPPYDDPALNERCRVSLGDRDLYAVPPLSPALCAWLMREPAQEGAALPKLDVDSLRFVPQDGCITASFAIQSAPRRRAARAGSVTFRRDFRLAGAPESGAACVLPAANAPYVSVWPNARMSSAFWKRYFVYAHRPTAVEVHVLRADGWAQGDLHESGVQSWQTASTDRFPAYVALRRGALSLGALPNDIPHRLMKHEPAAAIAIDFGSIATTVMLRQGERVQPACLPECMHHALLRPLDSDGDRLVDEFVPETALLPGGEGDIFYYSLMDMFTDVPEQWTRILEDGHIYYRRALSDLIGKSAGALYYDLKWGDEDYAQRCLRLFLKQVMVQAALAARLWGSPSASWRVSMPNALPPHKQEGYLEMMRALAREVAAECGLPLTAGCPPVLYATENQADGLYFLSRSEVNAQSGYLNMDIGGGTTDVSLWLNNAVHATIECSLLLGCREMLFTSLSEWHRQDLLNDLTHGSPALAQATQAVVQAFAQESASARGKRKCMLLDDLFASYAQDVIAAMEQARAEGRISYVESLLLFHIGFLFFLCGELLQRAYDDAELRPLLPQRMALCVAGNGGQLLKLFSDEQHARLCTLALSRLEKGHPLSVLLPVQSRQPKQEVARGLLSEDGRLQSAIQGVDRWNGTPLYDGPERTDLLSLYLPLFYRVFPQAAARLMPNAFENEGNGTRLTPTALMELDTIFANEKPRTPGDDMALYVRCLAQLKRLWRI